MKAIDATECGVQPQDEIVQKLVARRARSRLARARKMLEDVKEHIDRLNDSVRQAAVVAAAFNLEAKQHAEKKL
jgi:hypothetical protein